MSSSELQVIQSRRAVMMSAVRSFLHTAAIAALLLALLGVPRFAAIAAGLLLGAIAATRAKRVGVAFRAGRLEVDNYFRTVVFPEPSEVEIREYAANRMELSVPDGSRSSVQSAMWWSDAERDKFFELASRYNMKIPAEV